MELREVLYNLEEFVVSLHHVELRNQTLTSSLWVTCTLSWWTIFRSLTHSLDFFLLSNPFAFWFALVTYHASTFQVNPVWQFKLLPSDKLSFGFHTCLLPASLSRPSDRDAKFSQDQVPNILQSRTMWWFHLSVYPSLFLIYLKLNLIYVCIWFLFMHWDRVSLRSAGSTGTCYVDRVSWSLLRSSSLRNVQIKGMHTIPDSMPAYFYG